MDRPQVRKGKCGRPGYTAGGRHLDSEAVERVGAPAWATVGALMNLANHHMVHMLGQGLVMVIVGMFGLERRQIARAGYVWGSFRAAQSEAPGPGSSPPLTEVVAQPLTLSSRHCRWVGSCCCGL